MSEKLQISEILKMSEGFVGLNTSKRRFETSATGQSQRHISNSAAANKCKTDSTSNIFEKGPGPFFQGSN